MLGITHDSGKVSRLGLSGQHWLRINPPSTYVSMYLHVWGGEGGRGGEGGGGGAGNNHSLCGWVGLGFTTLGFRFYRPQRQQRA